MDEGCGEEPPPLGVDERRIGAEAKWNVAAVQNKQAIEEQHPPYRALLDDGDIWVSVRERGRKLAHKAGNH